MISIKYQKAPKYNKINGESGAQSSGNLIMVQRGDDKKTQKNDKNRKSDWISKDQSSLVEKSSQRRAGTWGQGTHLKKNAKKIFLKRKPNPSKIESFKGLDFEASWASKSAALLAAPSVLNRTTCLPSETLFGNS